MRRRTAEVRLSLKSGAVDPVQRIAKASLFYSLSDPTHLPVLWHCEPRIAGLLRGCVFSLLSGASESDPFFCEILRFLCTRSGALRSEDGNAAALAGCGGREMDYQAGLAKDIARPAAAS